MTPDAAWPNIADPLNITEAEHMAHTQRAGIHYPEDVGMIGKKAGKQLLKLTGKRPRNYGPRKKKHA